MIQFNNVSEFNFFLSEQKEMKIPLEEISSDSCTYIYLRLSNRIAYFNSVDNQGWVRNYSAARKFLENRLVDLRMVLARQFGGIRYSRQNYIEAQENLFNTTDNNEWKYDALLEPFLKEDNIKIGWNILNDSIFINSLNQYLNSISEAQKMDIEVPLLFFLADYSKKKYGNTVRTVVSKNQFGEEYKSLFLSTVNNTEIDLSNILFRSLYPDYERDDFETPQVVKVDIRAVKNYIDYNNSNRLFNPSHR